MITFNPFSVSSLAAQPPLIPLPITIASYVLSAIFVIIYKSLRCPILNVTDLYAFLQRLQLVGSGRDELLRNIPFKACGQYRTHDGRIEQFLRLIDLVPARHAACMIM